ncbi:MAG: hypothetical protein M1830_002870 [Pleopsidium flavum]|nr:MAG: hypothetical protein M1830_002870 [Pleopsidium flavum]
MEPVTSSTQNLLIIVKDYFKHYIFRFAASRDYQRVPRVLALARHILREELMASCGMPYHETAMPDMPSLVSIDDSGCWRPPSVRRWPRPGAPSRNNRRECLLQVRHTNGDSVLGVLRRHPELAINQDAHCLGPSGAIGIGRAYAFSGPERKMKGTIERTERLGVFRG